jgi:hypothetical protein
MSTEEKLDRLTNIVDALASSIVAHDEQIEARLRIAEKHSAEIEAQRAQSAALERRWDAYLNTLREN